MFDVLTPEAVETMQEPAVDGDRRGEREHATGLLVRGRAA